MDAAIQGLKVYTKKSQERLITATTKIVQRQTVIIKSRKEMRRNTTT